MQIGARVGYGFPVGSLEAGSRVSDTAYGQIPFSFDASYRVSPALAIGVYARYGIVVPTLCDPNACLSSLGSDIGLGIEARVLAPPMGPFAPWLGLGNGYEWYTSKLASGSLTSARHYRGFELLRVEAVGDLRFGSRFSIGPFVGATIGRFSHFEIDTPMASSAGDIRGAAMHGWLDAGMRSAVAF